MTYDIEGKVKLVQEPQTFGSGFTKREVVIVVEDGNYPQEINIEFVQDNVEKLDGIEAGDEVSIGFNIRGREYNGRYFNNLVGWKLSKLGGSAGNPDDGESERPEFKAEEQMESDDIPF